MACSAVIAYVKGSITATVRDAPTPGSAPPIFPQMTERKIRNRSQGSKHILSDSVIEVKNRSIRYLLIQSYIYGRIVALTE
jgi:hypothetical protein